jgi:putative FmdB family regulatory protein
MPTYHYRCPKCGHEYDRLQKITAKTRVKCPECGTPGERVITGGGGFLFKGSGFYATDYKKVGDKSAKREEQEKKPDAVVSKAPIGGKGSVGGKKTGADS